MARKSRDQVADVVASEEARVGKEGSDSVT